MNSSINIPISAVFKSFRVTYIGEEWYILVLSSSAYVFAVYVALQCIILVSDFRARNICQVKICERAYSLSSMFTPTAWKVNKYSVLRQTRGKTVKQKLIKLNE